MRQYVDRYFAKEPMDEMRADATQDCLNFPMINRRSEGQKPADLLIFSKVNHCP